MNKFPRDYRNHALFRDPSPFHRDSCAHVSREALAIWMPQPQVSTMLVSAVELHLAPMDPDRRELCLEPLLQTGWGRADKLSTQT